MKVLNIVESAYRATIEEQDDTIVWLTHAMQGAGADLAVLLRGNAVNYAVRGQDASGLAFGGWRQTQPPQLARDIAALIVKGVAVYAVEEDLMARGLQPDELVPGLERVKNDALAGLFASYDQVWHW
jgi:sulfur transfer complex TusBCD TusB component (DsrH family)